MNLLSYETWIELNDQKQYEIYVRVFEELKETELVRDILKEEVEKLEARVKELEAK